MFLIALPFLFTSCEPAPRTTSASKGYVPLERMDDGYRPENKYVMANKAIKESGNKLAVTITKKNTSDDIYEISDKLVDEGINLDFSHVKTWSDDELKGFDVKIVINNEKPATVNAPENKFSKVVLHFEKEGNHYQFVKANQSES